MRHLPFLAFCAFTASITAGCGMLGSQRSDAPVAATPSAPIRQVQLMLQQQGTYNGRVDGVAGPATVESIRLYQQAHKLDITGQVDDAMRKSLRLDENPAVEQSLTQMSDGSRISEAEARKLIESQGFTRVTDLYRDDSAVWRGMAARKGKTGEVAIDAKGNVVTN